MIKSFISPDNSMYLAELWLNDLTSVRALGFEKTGQGSVAYFLKNLICPYHKIVPHIWLSGLSG